MIGLREEKMNDIFTKFYLEGIGVEGSFNKFTGVDKDEDFHDHNFDFRSTIIKGSYVEEMLRFDIKGNPWTVNVTHTEGTSHVVKAGEIHRLISLPEKECTTLMIRLSPDKNKSGFFRMGDNGVEFRYWDEPEFKPYRPK